MIITNILISLVLVFIFNKISAQSLKNPRVTQKVTIHISNLNPDNYKHYYTKNENWNGFFSTMYDSTSTVIQDNNGSFNFSISIDSLGLSSGYRNDVISDDFSFSVPDFLYDAPAKYDTILSLSNYGTLSGLLLINNIRGPELANSIRIYFDFPHSSRIKVGVPFIRNYMDETNEYNNNLLYGISSWRGISFSAANNFTNDSLSQPNLSPVLGKIKWLQSDTVTITKKRYLNGCLLVDGLFSEKLSSILSSPYKGNSYSKKWYMKGSFTNLIWR